MKDRNLSEVSVQTDFGLSDYWTGEYAEDSLQLEKLWDLEEHMYRIEQFDSCMEISKDIIRLGKMLYEVRRDASVYEKYASAYGTIGWCLMEKGFLDEAFAYSLFSYDLLTREFGEEHILVTEVLQGIAFNLIQRGDFDLALEHIFKSLDLAQKIFKPDDYYRYYVGNILGNIAGAYRKKGELQKAIEYYQKALDDRILTEKWGEYWTGGVLHLIDCYLEIGDLAAAERTLQLGIHQIKDIPGQEDFLYIFEMARARIYIKKGAFSKAREAILRYIREFDQEESLHLGNPSLVDANFYLATIELELGRLGQAEQLFRKVVREADQYYGYGSTKQISALLAIADIQNKKGAYEAAIETIREGVERIFPGATKQEDPFAFPKEEKLLANQKFLSLLHQKAVILRDAYRARGEERYLAAAFHITQQTLSYLGDARLGFFGHSSKVALSRRAVPILELSISCAHELAGIHQHSAYLKEAYQSVEQVKGIILLENLNTAFIRNQADNSVKAMLEEEDRLLKERAMYEGFILKEQKKDKERDESKLLTWHRKRLALKEKRDSLLLVLEQKHPGFFDLKHNLPVSSVADLQASLESREVLINYFEGDSSLSIFTITNKRFFFHQFPWKDAEVAQLNQMFDLLGISPSVWNQEAIYALSDPSRKLFLKLFPAWQQLEQPQSLIIIPDGRLNFLPFQALLTEDGQWDRFRDLPYLIKSCAVRYQFSSSLLLQPFKTGGKPDLQYAGFAPAYEGSEFMASRSAEEQEKLEALYPEVVRDGLGPLRYNRSEVETAGALWENKLFLGTEATEANFKLVASKSNILHLALHALTNDQEPLLSQLVFSEDQNTEEDGKLHNFELQNLTLNADLAVLSACNTGAGVLRRGEGVMSVSRAFRLAGCPNIVMSLWQANDLSTQLLVTRFFRELKKGKGKADALQQATVDFLKNEDERYSHPFYWGNMVLVGDDMGIGDRGSRFGMWGVLVLGVLMLGFWVWWRF